MNFAALQKAMSRLLNRGNRKTTVYGDLPNHFDHRKDARERVAREARIGPLLLKKLSAKFPELIDSIQLMAKNIDEFARTGITPQDGYHRFRQIYFQTKGISNDFITGELAKIYSKPALPETIRSITGNLSAAEISGIVAELQRNGVYRLRAKLPIAFVNTLQESLKREATKNNGAGYNRADAARTFYREPILLSCPEMARLACDPLFYHVASQYLGVEPVLNFLTAWISHPHANEETVLSKGAQLFHADMSNPKFLKVFMYLNDVNEKNGPHCLVRGTHREKAPALWRDGRISDAEMAEYYPEACWDYEIGEAGSVFFVDTKAFHKGVPLIEGERHLAQFYYVDTLFGEHFPLSADMPAFSPDRFGSGIEVCSPRFLARYAFGNS
jgi:hypothetical protein